MYIDNDLKDQDIAIKEGKIIEIGKIDFLNTSRSMTLKV